MIEVLLALNLFATILLCVAVYKNRIIISENNGEIRVHDRAILAIEKKVEELIK